MEIFIIIDKIIYWLTYLVFIFILLLIISPTRRFIGTKIKIKIDTAPDSAKDIIIGVLSSIIVLLILKQVQLSNAIIFILLIVFIFILFSFKKKQGEQK